MYYVSYEKTIRSDYTDLGGDVEYDYVHEEKDFNDLDEAFNYFKSLIGTDVMNLSLSEC